MYSPNEVKVRRWKIWEEQIDRALREHDWNQSCACEFTIPVTDRKLRELIAQYSEEGWTILMDIGENRTNLVFCSGQEVFSNGSSQ